MYPDPDYSSLIKLPMYPAGGDASPASSSDDLMKLLLMAQASAPKKDTSEEERIALLLKALQQPNQAGPSGGSSGGSTPAQPGMAQNGSRNIMALARLVGPLLSAYGSSSGSGLASGAGAMLSK